MADRKVSSQQRDQQLHQLRVLEHFPWSAVQSFDLGYKFSFPQVVNLRILFRQLWSAPSGNKKMIRFDAMLRTQPAREFETNQRAHAMTKQRERSIEVWKDLASQRFNERFDSRVTWFSQSKLTARQHSGNHFNIGMNLPRPGTVNRAAAAGIRKTEQPETRSGIRLHLKPRCRCECSGAVFWRRAHACL